MAHKVLTLILFPYSVIGNKKERYGKLRTLRQYFSCFDTSMVVIFSHHAYFEIKGQDSSSTTVQCYCAAHHGSDWRALSSFLNDRQHTSALRDSFAAEVKNRDPDAMRCDTDQGRSHPQTWYKQEHPRPVEIWGLNELTEAFEWGQAADHKAHELTD